VDEHSLERIRNATFSHSVRGYDRGEVDQFLSELADWLERGGEDDAAVEAVRAELERIGEQTGSILTEAHDAAESIRADAADDARKQLIDANVTVERLRSGADEYAAQVREEADSYSRKTRTEADEYVNRSRPEAESEAKRIHDEAEADAADARETAEREAKRIVDEANRRRGDVEEVISDLEQRRDAVLAELDRLASGIAGTATQHRPHGEPGNGEAPESAADGEDTQPTAVVSEESR
jgi:DivIVA domain-containing protein